jgi:hypothetical protein
MQLDKFSRDFAEHFFRHFPELRDFARVAGPPGSAEGCLVVEITPPPAAQMNATLCISCDGDEVTVHVEHYHCHFYWPSESDISTFIDDDPIVLTRAILDETAIVASWWNNTEWVGSQVLRASDPLTKPDHFTAATRLRVRSWNGTFNRDVVGRL